jgi:hypothetical protein
MSGCGARTAAGGASGAGAAVWPPAIVNDARRAIHVAFNLVALFMRQPLFGSWPKLTRQRRKVMEITGARTCLRLSLSCSLRATGNPPMTCKLWLGTALGAERRITPFPCQRFDDGLTTGAHDSGPEWIAAPFLYRTFIDYPSPVSLAHYASGSTPLALIRVDVHRTAPYWHGASRGRSDIRSCWAVGCDRRENSGRWLVGGVLAGRRPRATRERPTVPPGSKSL